ncbi:MAG: Hpt domain-containing protein [Phycisphaerales bacterium]|nr:Hpt domain-containing protein [Phycisphaerales bacterium]
MATSTGDVPIRSKLVDEDPSYADLIQAYIHALQERVESLHEAIESQDLDRVRALAHQLKGSGGGHGYPILTAVAGGLEAHAVDRSIDQCRKALDELAAIIPRIVAGAPSAS